MSRRSWWSRERTSGRRVLGRILRRTRPTDRPRHRRTRRIARRHSRKRQHQLPHWHELPRGRGLRTESMLGQQPPDSVSLRRRLDPPRGSAAANTSLECPADCRSLQASRPVKAVFLGGLGEWHGWGRGPNTRRNPAWGLARIIRHRTCASGGRPPFPLHRHGPRRSFVVELAMVVSDAEEVVVPKGHVGAWARSLNRALESGHEPALSVMIGAHLAHGLLPLRVQPGALEATLGALEVGQRGVVVLALLGVDDPQPLLERLRYTLTGCARSTSISTARGGAA
jgi:hypothetical protein